MSACKQFDPVLGSRFKQAELNQHQLWNATMPRGQDATASSPTQLCQLASASLFFFFSKVNRSVQKRSSTKRLRIARLPCIVCARLLPLSHAMNVSVTIAIAAAGGTTDACVCLSPSVSVPCAYVCVSVCL